MMVLIYFSEFQKILLFLMDNIRHLFFLLNFESKAECACSFLSNNNGNGNKRKKRYEI